MLNQKQSVQGQMRCFSNNQSSKSDIEHKKLIREYLMARRENYVNFDKTKLDNDFYLEGIVKKIEDILVGEYDYMMDTCGSIIDQNHPRGLQLKVDISSYYPINNELNILPVIKNLQSDTNLATYFTLNHCLPVVKAKDKPLLFREYKDGDQLQRGKFFNTMEPKDSEKIVYPQVMIVPLVGFTEDCERIGYGGGFYDRTIKLVKTINNNRVLTIGVGYEAQKFDHFKKLTEQEDHYAENNNEKLAQMRLDN